MNPKTAAGGRAVNARAELRRARKARNRNRVTGPVIRFRALSVVRVVEGAGRGGVRMAKRVPGIRESAVRCQ